MAANIVNGQVQVIEGEYYFSEEAVSPANPAKICKLLQKPELLFGIKKILDKENADDMIEAFESFFEVPCSLLFYGWKSKVEMVESWRWADIYKI